MTPVSAVLIAYNEADKIGACLESVAWADERLVIDLSSTDATATIAGKHGARVVRHEWVAYCEPVRNEAVDAARHEWVLLIDADEHVSPTLAATIQRFVADDPPYDVALIERHNVIFDRVMAHDDAVFSEIIDHLPRLFRRGTVRWPEDIHALPDLSGLRVAPLPGKTDGVLYHYTRMSIDDSLRRLSRYTGIEADDLLRQGEHFSLRNTVIGALRKFLAVYIKQRTYRDGVAGFFWALECGLYRLFVGMQMWDREGREERHDAEINRWGQRLYRALNSPAIVSRVARRIIQRS